MAKEVDKLLNRFFGSVFKDCSVQLIITSNSPYVISDLPKDNIIFLRKEDEQCKVCDSIEFNQTFGANIHTLLTNSFFMDNTIGEFANRKIKEVVKDLNEKSREEILKLDGRKEEIEYIIDNIGEPVIKRKFESMYRTTFPEDMDNYKTKIDKLEKEKSKLQEILKDKKLYKIDNIIELLNKAIKELSAKVDDKND